MQKDFYKQLKNENFGFSELSYYESINPGIQRISEPGESNKATKYNRLATDVNIPLLKVKDGQNSWSNRFSFAKNKEGIYYDEKVNAQGYTERNYYDHNGNLILKRQIPDGEKTNTRDIIKVYDSKDRLRHILVPSESKKVADGNFSSNHNLIYEKNYHFDYDKDGKLISKYTPGKGLEEYVYDVWGRLILMQNEKEKSGNIWRYIKYDHLNRPIYHGRITSSSSPQTLRNRFNTNEQTANQHGHSRFEERTLSSNGIGYTTNKSFPNQISELHIDVIYFYDTYQIPHVSANVYNFKAVNTAHFSVPSIYPRASSRLTATYTKEIGASKWMKTIIYYDGKGRVLQTVADNHLGGTDRKTMVYDDFKELLTAQHHEHRSPGYTIDFTYLYEYDHRNRLSNVKHKTGNNPLVTLASNTYNNLGELERQSFHQVGGGQFLQSNTYKYDIAGRLLEVNNVNDMKDNYFAQRYTYNKNVPGGNSYKRYDGLISSITWKNIFDKQAYSYNFRYTGHNMLSEAQSNAALASNEKITYDIDGNIASLERAVKGLSKMQRYTYEYDNKGSLEKILDSSDRSAGAAVKTYSYDAIGNVSNDAGSIGSIQYNHLNLPDRISNENQTLHFKYSTLGHKLSMSTTDGQLTYDYVGEITYLNGYPLYISTPFGRILLIDEKPEYQYFIKDHLGNNRLTYTAEKHVEHYSATMEERQREQEEEVWKFTNIGNKRVPVSALLNATPSAQADATPKVIRLNAARGATDGLQKSLQVFPGDKVRASVKVKYFDASIFGTQAHLALNVLMGSSPMPAEGFDPNETHGNGGMASLPEPPKAYLNFVLVDKDDRILKIWDRRVSKEAAISPDALDKDHEELVIEEQMESAGYLLIFLSHVEASENIDLFFDDMHITHTHGPLVQYNDYFPFGMVNPAQSYLRERTLPNRYGFNGTESLESLGVKLNQTYFRLYACPDAEQIGKPQFARWMGVDPVDFHAYNGYHFSFNNPINFSDFWGDNPCGAGNEHGQNVNCDDETYAKDTYVTNKYGHWQYKGDGEWITIGLTDEFFNALEEYRDQMMDMYNMHDLFEDEWFRGEAYIEPGSYTYNRSKTGSGLGDGLSWGVTGFGAYAGARELSLVRNGQWLGANGKWYSVNWGGNGATGARSSVLSNAGNWKLIGRGAFLFGTAISVGQVFQNPTLEQGIQSGKDIAMGAVGTYGGPVGWTVSGVYFLDQFLRSVSPDYNHFRSVQGTINSNYGGATYVDSHGMYVCFTAETLISTEDGLKPIKELKEGVKIYSYNFVTDSIELQPVTKFFSRETRELYEISVGNEQISVTAEHPFYVHGKGWVKVKDLVLGDKLQSEHGLEIEISSISKRSTVVKVYNIEVAGNHNYFVTSSKVLVHNKNIVEPEVNKHKVGKQAKSEKQ